MSPRRLCGNISKTDHENLFLGQSSGFLNIQVCDNGHKIYKNGTINYFSLPELTDTLSVMHSIPLSTS
jgi:hypothetical protein